MKWLNFFIDPARVGPLQTPDCVGRAGGGCGDRVEIHLRFSGDVVADAAFLAAGCPAAIAGAAALADLLPGRTILEAAALGVREIMAHLADIPADRTRCLYLSETALAAALESYVSAGKPALAPARRAAVAMSGGVDSSATAFALQEAGWQVVGLTQRLHDFGRPGVKSCCTAADIDDAREVALVGGFPHFTVDMRDHFAREVIGDFCQAYMAGRTPNPCVQCNRRLRFRYLLETAERLGAAKLATGHYVRIDGPDAQGRFSVRRALDGSKDQSYMFWSANGPVLSKLLTPLGGLKKTEVRELARTHGLPTAAKSDSQDVCFVPDGDYAAFVCRSTGYVPRPGPIVNSAGNTIGRHRGLINYTIGQRRGIGIAAPEPLYVTGLETARATLIVGPKDELNVRGFSISQMNLIARAAGEGDFEARVMIRYNGEQAAAKIHPTAPDRAVVEFAHPFGPVAPGQSAVFYDGDLVLGGGVIEGSK